jgi:hypothetical protein
MRQLELGSVHHGFTGLVAARYADGLRGVVGLPTTGASSFTSLCAASILRLRQFVAGVIDHVPLRVSWGERKFETDKVFGDYDHGDQQEALKHPANEHAAIREHANRRFSGQGPRRASERRT